MLAGSKEINAAYENARQAYVAAEKARYLDDAARFMRAGDSHREDLEIELLDGPGLAYLLPGLESWRSDAARNVTFLRERAWQDEEDRRRARRVRGQERKSADAIFKQNVRGWDGLGHSTPTHKSMYLLAHGSARHAAYNAAQRAASARTACVNVLAKLREAYEGYGIALTHHSAVRVDDQMFRPDDFAELKQVINNAEAAFIARCVVS